MQHLTSHLRRLALVIGATACLVAPQTAAAQVLTAPRYHGLRPAGCTRFVFLDTSLRNCVYPDNTVGMWTDQDGGAVLVMFDDADGNGLQFTDEGLYLFELD
jgi:hypothetical protein